MREEILRRFEDNLARARNLVDLYRHVARPGQGRQPVHTVDILRAATVFLHAALEEVFRNIALWKYPAAPEAVLNEIPLVGLSDHGRPEKFFLGKLAAHRDKTVQQVLNASVDEFVGYFTVNNTTDISSFLRKVGVDLALVEGEFPTLTQFLRRRHHIVHQADRQLRAGRGHHQAQGLNAETVVNWIASVRRCVEATLGAVPD